MKQIANKKTTALYIHRHLKLLLIAAMAALVSVSVMAKGNNNNKSAGYIQTNLVSDLSGVAQLQDITLLNPWGISFSASGPFWVNDNGSGLSTVYSVSNDSSNGFPVVAKQSLLVVIPGAGVPTGQVFDENGSFNGDVFLFAGEDGTISGWRSDLGVSAELIASRTNAVYKGITLVTVKGNLTETNNGNGHGHGNQHNNKNETTLLLLANFSEGTVDIYDTNLDFIQISDPNTPPGYAPFNVQNIDGTVFVTFAKQDDAKHDDVAGAGNGFIDVLDLKNGRFHRFATGTDAGGNLTDINSPWGLALAPKSFTEHSNELLVGNFGSGTIMAFSGNGKFQGLLRGHQLPAHRHQRLVGADVRQQRQRRRG